MKHIQLKYNLMQIFFWAATCSVLGFIAIFLQSKGLNNTQIGTVTGGACILNIFLSPYITSITSKYNKISLQQYLMAGMALTAVGFFLCAYINMPLFMLMVLFMFVYCINVSMVPLMAMISVNYTAMGNPVNFGMARGLGSIAYAIAAVLFTSLVGIFDPAVLSLIYGLGVICYIILLLTTPKTYAAAEKGNEKSNPIQIALKYRTFFIILVGFMFCFAASTALSTYLINIIHNLGGSQNLYGIAIFAMAATELPVMAIAQKLQKRFSPVTLMGAAGFFYLLRNLLIATAPTLPILIVGLMCQGASYGLLTAVITVFAGKELEAKDQVMGQTMISMLTCGLGSCIGNVLGGVLQDTAGIGAMFSFAILLTIIGSSILIIVALNEKAGIVRKLKKAFASFI